MTTYEPGTLAIIHFKEGADRAPIRGMYARNSWNRVEYWALADGRNLDIDNPHIDRVQLLLTPTAETPKSDTKAGHPRVAADDFKDLLEEVGKIILEAFHPKASKSGWEDLLDKIAPKSQPARPPEPSSKSVVVDRSGRFWIRASNGGWTNADGTTRTWAQLAPTVTEVRD